MRMTAILQSDASAVAKSYQSQASKEGKIEDEEPFSLVEKVKEDLVKVSEILTKDVLSEAKAAARERVSEEDWEEFTKDEIEDARQSALRSLPTFEPTLPVRPQSVPDKDLNLAKVVDYLMNDIGASSLSKMADAKCRYEEMKKDGEEKQKRGIKPEHKLKMPPQGGMRSSPSEKDLSKLADSYTGTDAILESPDDFSHEQDKSPLSDSGFETRSDKTPSAPQSAESTGPKPLFTDVPIPPVITETRTEVVHIRSYEHPDDLCEPLMVDGTSGAAVAASAAAVSEPSAPAGIDPEPTVASLKDKVKAFQIKVNTEEDSLMSKSMCLKEETHITTTTRMVYHKPQLTEGSGDRMDETMSVRDIMKAFQSGRDPSKELAGLFEHKAAQDSIKGDELSPRFLDKDTKGKPKVERIIEVHIEKGNTSDPTEVIIRETKKHPDYRSMKELLDKAEGDYEVMQEEDDFAVEESLPSYLDTSRVNTPVSQEEDSRPSSAQLITDDSYKTLKLLSQQSIEYHDDEQSELRGESYRFAEKMLHSEKIDISQSDTEEGVADQARGPAAEAQGAEGYYGERASGTRKETHYKSKDASDKSGKFTQKDEPYDKLTVLHYTTEPGSPKHAVWMRFTQDRQDRNREKLIYEDRLDRTVKEAEEKLSEVSQFFRDKTEKLNDELQSPEKKPIKRVPRETRSGPSSMCSSPEKTKQKETSASEEWTRGSLRESSVGKLFGSERKSASVPSSPERRSQPQTSEEKSKQDSGGTPTKVPPPVAAKSSKVAAFKQKFEAEAQKQEQSTPGSPKPPVKKFQESKLPVYQPFQGSKAPKSPSEEEKTSPKKTEFDKSRTSMGPGPDVSRSEGSLTAPKQPVEQSSNKIAQHLAAQKHIQSDSVRATDKEEKRPFEMHKDKDQIAQSKECESSERDSRGDIQSVAPSESKRLHTKTETRTCPSKEQGPSAMPQKVASPNYVASDSAESGDTQSKTLRKKPECQIPVRTSGPSESEQFRKAKQDTVLKQPEKGPSQIPTFNKTRIQGRSELAGLKSQESTSSNLTHTSSVESKEKATIVTTREGFKGLKSLPVYVSVQSGKGDKDSGGQNGSHKKIITVKQKQVTSPQPSPDDDTLEQVSFIDSSGKSPMTPETPSSEEVSYDLMSRTPESLCFMPTHPSPIPEVSEESEGDGQGKSFSFKECPPERPKIITVATELSNANNGQVAKARRVAYIEFPPPPPLEDQSQPETKGSSSDADTEMMEVNLQEEHDKHLLAEPIIRVQPPSPVPPGADESSSSDDESVFQPIHTKKYKFKVDEEKEEQESKQKKQDKNGNHKDTEVNGSGKGDENDYELNGNDQSITDCSIATTAEFSHDTDATEIDSLDGYDLQDEDDGLSDQNAKPFSFGIDNRKDMWSTDSMLRPSDRAFSQTKLEAIEEEKLPEEEGKKTKTLEDGNENVINEKQSKSDGHSDTYFSYKLVEEFNTPFKTVATKGLDFDPWSSKGGDDEVVDARIKDDEPKPFGLAVDDKSQATSPDTTPARTPTDESTPTSEPNPFPFHEGKMFEMTRSGAIDMSKRDFVEERLQFFQIGEHTREARSGGERAGALDTAIPEARERDQFHASDATLASCSIIQITTDRRDTTYNDNTQDSSSDTMTASRVQSKLCSTFKVGVPMTSVLTMVGDYANQKDFKLQSSDDSGPSGLQSSIGIQSFQIAETSQPEQRRHFQTENSNNNNNMEASNTHPSFMQCDSPVFSLMSYSVVSQNQPESTSENVLVKDHTVKVEDHKVQSEAIKTLPCGNIKEPQPKSRLPVRAPLSSPCSQSTSDGNRKQKPKQAVRPIVRPVVRERLDPFPNLKPKTRIPVKVKTVSTSSQREVKSGTVKATLLVTKTTSAGVSEKERGIKLLAPSRLPVKDKSSRTTFDPSTRSRSSSNTNRAGQSRPVSSTTADKHKGTTRARVKHRSQQSTDDTKVQADASVDDDSTSRNSSLSDASQSTHTSRSARDVRAVVEQADRERRRRSRTSRRKSSSCTDGAEGSQVEGPQKVPSAKNVNENEPSL